MTDARWKRNERQVAAAIGGTRLPNNGRPQADIVAGPFAVESKARKSLPAWLTDALRQARNGADGRTPIVVLTEVSQGRKARRYVVMNFADFVEWWGDPQERAFA